MNCVSEPGSVYVDSSGKQLKLTVGHTYKDWKDMIDDQFL